MTVVLAIATNLDSGNQEANQLLDNGGGIAFGLAYLVMFAIPLLRPLERPSWGVRVAAICGFGTTLLYVVPRPAFPVIDVSNPLRFTVKIVAFVVATNAIAAGLVLASGAAASGGAGKSWFNSVAKPIGGWSRRRIG